MPGNACLFVHPPTLGMEGRVRDIAGKPIWAQEGSNRGAVRIYCDEWILGTVISLLSWKLHSSPGSCSTCWSCNFRD